MKNLKSIREMSNYDKNEGINLEVYSSGFEMMLLNKYERNKVHRCVGIVNVVKKNKRFKKKA